MWFQIISFVLFFSYIHLFEIKCPKSGNYIHVKPLSECREYYKCSDGSKEIFTCPQGTIYSSKDQGCKASGTCRELVCAGRVNGKYVDPIENCSRIYRCFGGELDYVQTCTEGLCPHNCPLLEQSTATVSNHRDICETRNDGFYALKNCTNYVKCINGSEDSFFECPKGKKFNGLSCVENFQCGNPCAFKPDGHHADDNSCNEYSTCKNGNVFSRNRCPPGSFFDGVSCVVSHVCPQKCHLKADGVYADYSKNCSSYYECHEGKIHEKTCHEKVFDGKKCVDADIFYCHGPTSSADCEDKNGFYWNQRSNCTKYHFCNFGLKVEFECPENQAFNGTSCVPKDKFSCPHNSCEHNSLGYYQDTESQCRSYYFCIDGNKISYVCPKNKIFNGKECVSPSSYKCLYSECNGKLDGYVKGTNELYFCKNGTVLSTLKCGKEDSLCHFASSETLCSRVKKGYVTDLNCRAYHKCSKFSSVESGICKETQVYNGKSCVTKDRFRCPRTFCSNLQNGFYQNFNSRCQKYFFCINGQKTDLVCPEGKIHNGDICVDQIHYKCPKILTLNKTIFNFL